MKSLIFVSLLSVFLISSNLEAKDKYHVGDITAEKIISDFPKFEKHKDDVFYSDDQLAELKNVNSAVTIKVFFGQWCHDSQREVPRIIQLFKQVNNANITLEYYGLDLRKSDPLNLAEQANIKRTPTIILYQDEQELGRILEVPRMDWASDISLLMKKRT